MRRRDVEGVATPRVIRAVEGHLRGVQFWKDFFYDDDLSNNVFHHLELQQSLPPPRLHSLEGCRDRVEDLLLLLFLRVFM